MSRRTLATVSLFVLPLAVVSSLLTWRALNAKHGSHLQLEMASSNPSYLAQVFFDTGKGYSETQSRVFMVHDASLSAFQTLKFDLPEQKIYNLRFDPMQTEGRIIVRNVAVYFEGKLLASFPPESLEAANQIAKVSAAPGEFVTTPGANDPYISLKLRAPLDLTKRSSRRLLGLLFFELGLIGVALVLSFERFRNLWSSLQPLLQRVARRLSNPLWIEFDALSIFFYFLCLLVALGASLAKLNGSSVPLFQSVYHHGATQTELIGESRQVRSDEWSYSTPAILYQGMRVNAMSAEKSPFGGHYISLVSGVPVKHFTSLFRPQFWGFFVLPIEYAFSFYWQMKGLILLSGTFTFLLWLTRSSAWSIAGCLWFYFSAFTQWTYSWPLELPEMIGCICWTMVLADYLFVGRNRWALLAAALACATSAIDFVMCAYVPQLLPLAWLAVFVFVARLVAKRRDILIRDAAGTRLAAVCIVLLLAAVAGLTVYHDLHQAIVAVADTSYPGKRIVPSGAGPFWQFPANFFDWWEKEDVYPVAFGNISEGSGFLWLAPLSLLNLFFVKLDRHKAFAMAALCAVSALFLAWLFFPLPSWLGVITGFNRVPGTRFLPALGLANVAIVITVLCVPRTLTLDRRKQTLLFIVFGVVASASFVFLLRATNLHLGGFFSNRYVYWSALIAGILAALMWAGFRRTLAVALVAANALAFGTVNPLEQGLGVFYQSELASVVRHHPDLLKGKWIVYSPSVVSSGFFESVGCDVYNTYRYIPDIDHFKLFAQHNLDVALLNRLGYFVAVPEAQLSQGRLQLANTVVVEWHVAPSDPLLQELNIKFVAFDFKPSPLMLKGLSPIVDHAVDGFWLYQFSTSP